MGRGTIALITAGAVVLVLVSPSIGLAATLTVGCSGTLTTSNVPKDGVQSDPEKDSIADFSVVVDTTRRTVSGFWSFENGLGNDLPIVAETSNSITFKGRDKRIIEKSIEGTVDRITGKVD